MAFCAKADKNFANRSSILHSTREKTTAKTNQKKILVEQKYFARKKMMNRDYYL